MSLHHVIEAQQFDVPMMLKIFETAEKMEKVVAGGGMTDYHNRIMATLFYEPSTRTRFSFETAMHRLGGHVISTENAAEFSSVAKGETLEDTIRILNGYADVIVIRHKEVGSAKRAAAVSRVPIINAGDGEGITFRTSAPESPEGILGYDLCRRVGIARELHQGLLNYCFVLDTIEKETAGHAARRHND